MATRLNEPTDRPTATLPFLVYLGTVVAYVWKRDRLMVLPGAFDLGAWARPVTPGLTSIRSR